MNHLQHSKKVINTIKERADRVNPFLSNEEIWIPAIDLEEIFEVSNLGNVRSIDRDIIRSNGMPLKVKGKVIKTNTVKGYKTVGLRIQGTTKKNSYKVHNLVYESFVERLKDGFEVDHKDRDKTNNALNNLRSVSRRINCLNKTNNKKIPGVVRIKSGFYSKIHFDGKNYHLGSYQSDIEAGNVYQNAVMAIENGNFSDFYKNIKK